MIFKMHILLQCAEKDLDQGGPRMIVKMALYGLKSLRAASREKLAGVLHDIGYTPYKADPDV